MPPAEVNERYLPRCHAVLGHRDLPAGVGEGQPRRALCWSPHWEHPMFTRRGLLRTASAGALGSASGLIVAQYYEPDREANDAHTAETQRSVSSLLARTP